jgi:hypothetical protein
LALVVEASREDRIEELVLAEHIVLRGVDRGHTVMRRSETEVQQISDEKGI